MKNSSLLHITSVIGLKPECVEPYKLLHRNVFPAVLQRIAESNIGNYSIFYSKGILFSHYEYFGLDYNADLQNIADDHTRQWWKLTDPMQEPLTDRKAGEWWAETECLYSDNNAGLSGNSVFRVAFVVNSRISEVDLNPEKIKSTIAPMKDYCTYINISVKNDWWIVYIEIIDSAKKKECVEILKTLAKAELIEMEEVFYTDEYNKAHRPKVFVTGCFDMLHSGHIAFLEEASAYGDLYVCIGSDENVFQLKGRKPVVNQNERKYMIQAVRHVKECRINSGFGIMDFLQEINEINPDVFVVNEDGNTPAKEEYCRINSIEYRVLKRIPHGNLPVRSTTSLRNECIIPYRIDLAGGWLDQPFVSKFCPGPVLTISIEPTIEFNNRSGMATSTRNKAIELWKTEIPAGDREQLAKILFTYENPPGTMEVSGSQDSLGIVMPGLNKLNYSGNYWPDSIETVFDEDILYWLEDSLYLVPLEPRQSGYHVLENTSIHKENANSLSIAAENCWKTILNKDIQSFGMEFRNSFEAQVAMFPNMLQPGIPELISLYKSRVKGWKLSGAGGGGYLILVSDTPVENALRIKIRRKSD